MGRAEQKQQQHMHILNIHTYINYPAPYNKHDYNIRYEVMILLYDLKFIHCVSFPINQA